MRDYIGRAFCFCEGEWWDAIVLKKNVDAYDSMADTWAVYYFKDGTTEQVTIRSNLIEQLLMSNLVDADRFGQPPNGR